ncbi:hypothetical protein J4456_00320 [Candidatus Pacearchaeota archaeon]|nr:hypothetical protein [Candidatus Pacearchaeota archaeon]
MKFKTSNLIGTMNALAAGMISYNYLTDCLSTGNAREDYLMGLPILMISILPFAFGGYIFTTAFCDKLKRKDRSSENNRYHLENNLERSCE